MRILLLTLCVCSVMVPSGSVFVVHAEEQRSGQTADSGPKTETTAVSPSLSAETVDRIEKLNAEIVAGFRKELDAFPAIEDGPPGAVSRYSRRGDLHLFLGRFAEAESDYEKMVDLDPSLDASHWRAGIASYFAGNPEKAAAQFDRYHSFDNVDRENGIWRYFSHRAAFGKERAQAQLLKYEKDDRPPFREVYRLFESTMTAAEVLDSISPALPDSDRNARLFYAHLYIGLNASVEEQRDTAIRSLAASTLNPWGRTAGYGPNYMWHVGRLEYLRLHKTVQP